MVPPSRYPDLVQYFHNLGFWPETTLPFVREQSDVFLASLTRISTMVLLPAATAAWAGESQFVADLAMLNVHRTLTPSSTSAAFTPELAAERSRIIESLKDGTITPANQTGHANWFEHGAYNVEQFVAGQPDSHSRLQSLYASVIVSVWGGFEALCADLWKSSVSAYPSLFLRLDGSPKRILNGSSAAKRDTDDGDASLDDSKYIPIADIGSATDYSFDLTGKWGEVVAGRFKFISLFGIRTAYSVAFSERVRRARTDRIDKTLSNRALDALSALRNLIVHKGGVADQEYSKQTKRIATLPKVDLKARLHLDGDQCRSFVDPVITCCKDLIESVDSWIVLAGGKDGAEQSAGGPSGGNGNDPSAGNPV